MKAVALLTFSFALVACHDDHSHDTTGRPAVCLEIVERCHPLDLGSGPVHDCHESAEATWDEATCNAKKAACFAACTAADGGSDAPADGG